MLLSESEGLEKWGLSEQGLWERSLSDSVLPGGWGKQRQGLSTGRHTKKLAARVTRRV